MVVCRFLVLRCGGDDGVGGGGDRVLQCSECGVTAMVFLRVAILLL